ncbi:MAG: DUF349 domain-containing protein [Cytophagales bacterium]|nr:DUF349 domain-containing protein [Cytophagales bacterium]
MMETEANESVEVLNEEVNDSMDASHDDREHAPEETGDLSSLTKKELVDLLKTLVQDEGFKDSEAAIRELRSKFEEIQHQEKTEALKRFLEQGGILEDFDYRLDVLDIAFESNFKILRNKRHAHFRGLEEQKNENLRLKNELLDALRNLVDGEDDKHSFDKFKDIQTQWRTLGQVPAAKLRPLWASYHALVDRFYDNREIYFELKELDRKKNLEAKQELCVRAEKLADVEKVNDAIRELHELHEDYKHIGPVAREEKDAVWERFKAASDAVYERRDALVADLNVKLAKNLTQKEEIISQVTALTGFESDRIKEWNQKTQEVQAMQKAWGTIGAVPRSKAREINKQFWSAFKKFFSNKGKFFGKLDETRTQNLNLMKELVLQAEAIKDSTDAVKASNELKALQAKWKEIGPVQDKQRDKVYKAFKAACDHFFSQRRLKFEESDREQAENLAKKEALCVELESMISSQTGNLERLRALQGEFHALGFVPRQSAGAIKARFTTLFQQAMASLKEVSQDEKDRVMLEIQLENLKTDPDAGMKIQQREFGLKKRIQKEENDLGVLKNNLEFFGRSKNSEKMRAEFSEKISRAEAEIGKMKQQLKQLRAATR